MSQQGTPVRDHIVNDAEGIAQWIFRKICNHDPMRFRSPMNRKGRHKEEPIYATDSLTSVLYPLQDGRVFMCSVQELTDEQIAEQRTALGAHFVERQRPGKIPIKKTARAGV
jgi:hypothetical protein